MPYPPISRPRHHRREATERTTYLQGGGSAHDRSRSMGLRGRLQDISIILEDWFREQTITFLVCICGVQLVHERLRGEHVWV